MPSDSPSSNSAQARLDRDAADWLARRDRGLSAAEQDDYLQWLREDPARATTIARHEETVRRLQNLAQWEPAHSSEPNPDLFARPRRRAWRLAAGLIGMAAAIALGSAVWVRRGPEATTRVVANGLLRVNERQVLADKSVVELRDGSRIEVAFSEHERRVRLVGGEAQFTVTKNAQRPFIVEAGGVAVRAVGTVFAVRLDAATVDVLVTEGKVRVEQPPGATSFTESASPEAPLVAASERAVVSLAVAHAEPTITPMTPDQIKEMLAWQAPRFQFYETPLAEAVAEFNQRNRHQLSLGDPTVGALRIGGTFRADNIEGFVSLLQLTLGIRSEQRGERETVLFAPR
jgi:transmembrane sensor